MLARRGVRLPRSHDDQTSRGRVQEHDTSIRGNPLSKNANENSAAIGPAVWSERLTSNHNLPVGVTSGGSETADPGSVL